MGAPGPVDVVLVEGEVSDPVILAYDTGIR
jgi:hypothetical protein